MSSVSSISAQLQAHHTNRFAKIDKNSDGAVSKDEFVSARPKQASEAQASALYDKIDTQKSNALTQDQLNSGLKANRPNELRSNSLSDKVIAALLHAIQQAEGKSSTEKSGKPDLSQEFSRIDANSDGAVTKEEFISGRPDGVSEQDAEAIFKSIDSENTGAISKEQFSKSFEAGPGGAEGGRPNGPPPGGGHGGPPPAKGGDESKSTSKTTNYEKEDLNKDGKVSDAEKLAAAVIKAQEAAKLAAKQEAQKLALAANTATSAYSAATKTDAISTVQTIA